MENLFLSWYEFKKGKTGKEDVLGLELELEDNLFKLHQELKNKTYQHSDYTNFYITDPKLRHIHKAKVRDRVVHHAVFRKLYPVFDKHFIYDSYSCRIDKGTHRAVKRLETFAKKLSKNYRQKIYYLKCDVKKFFASVDQKILLEVIEGYISDTDAIWLISQIISSFEETRDTSRQARGKQGIPLGNVTSQLFCNIYLNELDQFIKHQLKAKHYIRYCDDFVLLSRERGALELLVPRIQNFLSEQLNLKLHPDKIIIRTLRQGVDFLGYVILPHHIVMRTKTKKRMLKKLRQGRKEVNSGDISPESYHQSVQSYLGMLQHCNAYDLESRVKKEFLAQ